MYALHKQQYPILGAGLWGEVIDADDYVIKFSKRRCAGLGDGLVKVQREADVLRGIARSPIQSDTAFAQLIGWGTSEADKGLSKRHMLWLKTTKLPGQTQAVQTLLNLPSAEGHQVARSIASALFNVHKQLERIAKLPLSTPSQSLQTICEDVGDDAVARCYVQQLVSTLATLGADNIISIHGDFNLSNLLFEGSNVCGVVDFAEARQGFAEEDLAAVIAELPAYRSVLVKSYEERTGCRISERRLNYGLALKAFLSFAIARRLNNCKISQGMEKKLHRYLQRL